MGELPEDRASDPQTGKALVLILKNPHFLLLHRAHRSDRRRKD
jgi:hypothetical protein